jgi:hypothetical protein
MCVFYTLFNCVKVQTAITTPDYLSPPFAKENILLLLSTYHRSNEEDVRNCDFNHDDVSNCGHNCNFACNCDLILDDVENCDHNNVDQKKDAMVRENNIT